MTTSRIMLIGDSHGDFGFLGTCMERAADLGIDTAVQLGDFGIWPGPRGRNFLDSTSFRAVQSGVTLYAFTGNHDDQTQIGDFEQDPDADGFVTLRPNLRWIPRAHRWAWHGVRFGALGGAFSIDWQRRIPGIDWWPGAEEVHKEDVELLGTDRLDVLLTHDAPDHAQPPALFELASQADEIQSRLSRYWLRLAVENTEPELLVHGHWHKRNQTSLALPSGSVTLVEGLGANMTPQVSNWGVLDLTDLSFTANEPPVRIPSGLPVNWGMPPSD